MAGKFFKSFFPMVKAQEEAELVNPQEVLRVSSADDMNMENSHNRSLIFVGGM